MSTTTVRSTLRSVKGAVHKITAEHRALEAMRRHAKTRQGVHCSELVRKFYANYRHYSHYDRGRGCYWICVYIVSDDYPLALHGTGQMQNLLLGLEKRIKRQLQQMDVDVRKVSVSCTWQVTQFGDYAQLYATIWHNR